MYYSIIRYFPNTLNDEGFAIGLIITDEQGLQFKFDISYEKIKRINSIMGIQKSRLLESFFNYLKSSNLDKKKLNYLSIYENGSLRYTPPKILSTDSNDFESLFEVYFRQFVTVKKVEFGDRQKFSTSRISHKFKTSLRDNSNIKERLNLDYDLKNSNLSNYFISTSKIDFVGVNGNIFAGEFLDLNNSEETVGAKLNQTIAAFKTFEENFPDNYAPEECKILLLQEQFDNKKEYVEKLEAWSNSAGYSLFIRPSLEQFSYSIEEIVKRKNINRFDEWINRKI